MGTESAEIINATSTKNHGRILYQKSWKLKLMAAEINDAENIKNHGRWSKREQNLMILRISKIMEAGINGRGKYTRK